MEHRRFGLCLGIGLSFAFVSIFIYLLMSEKSRRKSTRYIRQAEDNVVEDRTMDFPFLKDAVTIDLIKNSRVMFIMRGLPGSGKSSVTHCIKQMYGDQAVICSADEFRYSDEGEYIWNEEEYEKTHLMCQEKAMQVCKQEQPVVIIDNTNVHKKKLFRYVSLASRSGYLVVIVEPKTAWKLNVTELTRRNSHNVTEEVITKMLSEFDPVIAVYYGWFLSERDSLVLRDRMKELLMDCLSTIPQFRDSLVDYNQEEQTLSPDSSENLCSTNLTSLSIAALADSPRCLHLTNFFSKKRQAARGNEYATSPEVQEALGSATTLSIIGWTVSQRTVTARVKLNPQQLKLWSNFDSDSFKVEGDSFGETCVTGPATSATRNPDLPFCPASYTNVDIKPTMGRGDTAHITLSFAAGETPVQGRYDLSDIIHREVTDQGYKEYTVLQGIARDYCDGLWVVYLNQPLAVNALFTGHYGS